MKIRVLAFVGWVALGWVWCAAADAQVALRQVQPAEPRSGELKPRESWVRVVRPYVGNPILVIDYPWKMHAHPSIELQLLPDGQPEPLDARPFTFVEGYMKGDLALDVYRSQDRGERVAFMLKVAKYGVDFEINGKRNSLSKPAAWVDFHWKRPDLKIETRTAFCLLDYWAVDDRTLYLDLPTAYYAQPGRLRVWMLAGKDTVWVHTIAWPGMPTASGAIPKAGQEPKAGNQPPADEKPADAGPAGVAGKAPAAGRPSPPAKPAAAGKAPKPTEEPAPDKDNPFR